ncbi:MAG TPA: polysaccharide deacetylase family protein [Paludibacter sp.]|nr:polysaccharide deacetylase family protein [Paludibacter sp.]
MKVQVPDILRPFLGKLTWRKSPSSKVIYLTFDDGPVPEATPHVLDLLDEHNLKATFFCVGDNVRKYPDIYTDILARGHKTGNHTFNHLSGAKVSTNEYIQNVDQASTLIDSRLFRPPHGLISRKQKKLLQPGYEIVMWDVLTCDYDSKLAPWKVLNNITRYSRNGSIVVFHDSVKAKENMLAVLPEAIRWWKNQGYGFGTL